MIIKYDVFGKKMSVIKQDEQWQLFSEPAIGVRSRIYDVIIPPDLKEDELARYLGDMYHEYASDKHPGVIKIK